MSPDHESLATVDGNDTVAGKPMPLIVLEPRDNVATALQALETGDLVRVNGMTLRLLESVAVGHKVALVAIDSGEPVIKYGEVIGRATTSIDAGEHVHTHNVVSLRLPGPAVDQR